MWLKRGSAKGPRTKRGSLQHYLRYSHLGLQFCISVALFTGLGVWLDRKLETVVVFTLIGLALGFGGGMYSIYKAVYGMSWRRRGEPPREDSENDSEARK